MNLARVWRLAMALVAAGAMAGGALLSSATGAFADYGSGAQYQIEISENCNGQQTCYVAPGVTAQGDGVWLWIELNANGTGDYTGSDCIHNSPIAPNGGLSDKGDVTHWSVSNGNLVIEGVTLIGNTVPVTITVPATEGHYALPGAQVITTLGSGTAQVQVAP